VNNITAEEALEDTNVLMGMLSIDSHPTVVLFDSGASHSFIKRSYVVHYNIPTQPLRTPFHIEAPGAELLANRVVPRANLDIEGVNFPTELIVIDTQGLDVILGMKWLAKHDAIINCTPRTVDLKNPTGSRTILNLDGVKTCLYALEGSTTTNISSILVVYEFPDVFPEELPGMPPDRDIEFVIELKPGTAPISRRPYRMPPNELAELKKQLKELLDKGFIHPSSSPWAAQLSL